MPFSDFVLPKQSVDVGALHIYFMYLDVPASTSVPLYSVKYHLCSFVTTFLKVHLVFSLGYKLPESSYLFHFSDLAAPNWHIGVV